MLNKIFEFFKNIWKFISNDDKRGEPLKPPYRVTSNTSIQQEPIDIKKEQREVSKKKFSVKDKVSKKFSVKENRNKNFVVKATRDISPPGSSSSESGKLKHITKTRPKKCPLCRTENEQIGNKLIINIILTPEKKWKCKACEYEWQ